MTSKTDLTIIDQLLEDGPLTVKQLTELLGKAETTVRNVLKGLVASEVVAQVEGSKPTAYEVVSTVDENTEDAEVEGIVETVDVPAEPAEITDEVIETEAEAEAEAEKDEDEDEDEPLDAESEAKLDELLGAITALPAPTPPKIKKSRKVCTTPVPRAYNFFVQVNGEKVMVTEAYPFLIAVPTFASLDELLEHAQIGEERLEGDHSAHEIAALYYRTVARYLEMLYDGDLITRQVWYGRTCRLRHKVLGHGRGTALAKPVGKTSDN